MDEKTLEKQLEDVTRMCAILERRGNHELLTVYRQDARDIQKKLFALKSAALKLAE